MRRVVTVSLIGALIGAALSTVPMTFAGAGTKQTCQSVPKPGALPFLLPPWSDATNWTDASQYETIQSADVDGDGRSELVGRNGGALEVYSWAPPLRTGDPDPGQWMTQGAGPALAWNDGWIHEDQYRTIQFADIDGDGADEMLARAAEGIRAWKRVGTSWVALPDGPDWTDGAGWDRADAYSTIQTGDLDGNGTAELLGMHGIASTTDFEMVVYTYVPSSATTGTWQALPSLTLGDGWGDPAYYSPIQTGDLDGDGADELVFRGADGIEMRKLVGGTWADLPNGPAWSDAGGFDQPDQYETIQTGDVDGDGRDDLLAMARDGATNDFSLLVDTYVPASATTGTWQALPSLPLGDGWGGAAEYYATIQTGDVVAGGGAEVLARSSAGLEVFTLDGGAWSPGPVLTDLSDANHWNEAARYPTIHAVPTATGELDVVIGRAAAGIETWGIESGAWADASAAFPSWAEESGDQSDPLHRAYRYINNKVGESLWADDKLPDGNWVPIRDQFSELDISMTSVLDKVDELKPRGLNISRADWDHVRGEMHDWVNGVSQVRDYFGVGGTSNENLYDLALTKLVVTGDILTSVHDTYFHGNPTLIAFLSDLLWGVIAGLAAFAPEALLPALTFAASVAGSGVAASIQAFGGGSDKVQKEYDKLLMDLPNYFCGAVFQIDESYTQTITDYGLLTTASELVENGTWGFTTPSWNAMLAAMERGQNIWSFQQLAAEDWRAGYCTDNPLGDYICVYDNDNDNVYDTRTAAGTTWRGIGGTDCLDHHNDAWDALRTTYGVQLADVFAPRNEDGLADADPIGTGGWRLKVHDCDG